MTVFLVALFLGSITRFPTPRESENVAFGIIPNDIDFPLISFPVESVASMNRSTGFGEVYWSTTNFALSVWESPRPKVINFWVVAVNPFPSLISRYEVTPGGRPNNSTSITPGVFPLNAFREIDRISESAITWPCNAGGIFCGETSSENVFEVDIISNWVSAHLPPDSQTLTL